MPVTYTTTIEQVGNNTGVPVPDAVLDELGGGRRPRVVADLDGYELRTSIGSMGGRALLAFSAAHRTASGLGGGDEVTVTIAIDETPEVVSVPDDLATALDASADARAFFDGLSPSYQRNFVTQVESARAADTRARRIATTITKLESGQKR